MNLCCYLCFFVSNYETLSSFVEFWAETLRMRKILMFESHTIGHRGGRTTDNSDGIHDTHVWFFDLVNKLMPTIAKIVESSI